MMSDECLKLFCRLKTSLNYKSQSKAKSRPQVLGHDHQFDTNKDPLIILEYSMMEITQKLFSKGGLYEILQQATQTLLWS